MKLPLGEARLHLALMRRGDIAYETSSPFITYTRNVA